MKKIILTLAILAACTLAGCKTNKQAMLNHREYISWMAFCAERGYNINDNSSETINDYLDTWRGSVDEENALIKAGVEPY